MNELLQLPETVANVIPPKLRPWAVILAWLLPYLTRAAHSLYSGGGIKGALAGIWLGTNSPAAPPKNEKNVS